MSMIPLNQCLSCVRFDQKGGGLCNSFPEGIPDDIFFGRARHDTSINGEPAYKFAPGQQYFKSEWDRVAPGLPAAASLTVEGPAGVA